MKMVGKMTKISYKSKKTQVKESLCFFTPMVQSRQSQGGGIGKGKNGISSAQKANGSIPYREGETMKKELKVRMFGGFSLQYGEKELTENIGRTKKVWALIEFLLAHRGKDVSQENLMEALWGGAPMP